MVIPSMPLLETIPYDHDDPMLAATLADGRARGRAYRWQGTAVVIGRGNRQGEELRSDRITADGVPLLRRAGGGCSVVLDPGNVIISLAVPLPGLTGINKALAAIGVALIDHLAACGVRGVKIQGVSDLTLAGRKIGGSCIYRTRDLLYYSTTLLADPDLELVERYLLYPPREPDYRAGRNHRQFMGSLVAAGVNQGPEQLAHCLNERLVNDFSLNQDKYGC